MWDEQLGIDPVAASRTAADTIVIDVHPKPRWSTLPDVAGAGAGGQAGLLDSATSATMASATFHMGYMVDYLLGSISHDT